MKKIFYYTFSVLLSFCFLSPSLKSQVSSNIATVSIVPIDPQSGPHNYFGVRLTLNQSYDQDVTVTGFIYDQGDPNTDHPYEITVTAGNTTEMTSPTFYETDPTADVEVSITSFLPFFVTKDDVYYCSVGEAGSFTVEFGTLFSALEDTATSAQEYLAGIITLNEEEVDEFITSLYEEGVSETATTYDLNSNHVQIYKNKLDTMLFIYDELAESLFGDIDIDTITSLQINELGLSMNLATCREASEEIGSAPDCWPMYNICVTSMIAGYVVEAALCTINILATSPQRRACRARALGRLFINQAGCYGAYSNCLN